MTTSPVARRSRHQVYSIRRVLSPHALDPPFCCPESPEGWPDMQSSFVVSSSGVGTTSRRHAIIGRFLIKWARSWRMTPAAEHVCHRIAARLTHAQACGECIRLGTARRGGRVWCERTACREHWHVAEDSARQPRRGTRPRALLRPRISEGLRCADVCGRQASARDTAPPQCARHDQAAPVGAHIASCGLALRWRCADGCDKWGTPRTAKPLGWLPRRAGLG